VSNIVAVVWQYRDTGSQLYYLIVKMGRGVLGEARIMLDAVQWVPAVHLVSYCCQLTSYAARTCHIQ